MNDDSIMQVGIGEIKVAGGGKFLRSTLGSCIGIGFIWRKGGRCALAHCLLPIAPGPLLQLGARYVNQAVPSLVTLMGLRSSDFPDVEVIVAGGARMFSISQNSANIGRQNAEAAAETLAKRGFVVAHSQVGGRRGRQIIIDCAAQQFQITHIARQPEEVEHGTS